MNPCPCGYADEDRCQCHSEQIKRYLARLSGPLIDRIDMQVKMSRLPPALLSLSNKQYQENSAKIRLRVSEASNRQLQRQNKFNHALRVAELNQYAQLEPSAQALLDKLMVKLNLSARAYHRVLKVALTIADLENCPTIQEGHISEAFGFRCLDRGGHE